MSVTCTCVGLCHVLHARSCKVQIDKRIITLLPAGGVIHVFVGRLSLCSDTHAVLSSSAICSMFGGHFTVNVRVGCRVGSRVGCRVGEDNSVTLIPITGNIDLILPLLCVGEIGLMKLTLIGLESVQSLQLFHFLLISVKSLCRKFIH